MRKLLALAAALALLAGAADAQQVQSQNPTNLSTPPITCSTTATLVASARVRNAITLTVPSGGATVYVGGAGVTTATGFPIAANFGMTMQPYNGPVYCVVVSSTQTLNVLENY